jgi:hypothetical protein
MKAPSSVPRDDRDLLGQVETEFTRQFGGRVPDEEIRQTAADSLRPFERARIKDYILILALRAGRLRLRSRASAPA